MEGCERLNTRFDLIIIGGGVIGSAIAREFSRYRLRVAVLEKNLDVCYETSGRNSAVIHGGFAYDPGTLKAALCVEGCLEFPQTAEELDVPFKQTGKVLVGNTPEEMESLHRTMETGNINGARDLRIIDQEELHRLVPAVVGEFALFSPHSGILDPFAYTVALAENAVHNGASFHFDQEVTAIDRQPDGSWQVTASNGVFNARWVVNAAGLGCGKISDLLGIKGYRVIGSKGNYIVLDKRTGPLLPMPVYPVPSNTYMGIHVTPTVDGNVTVGPDASPTDNFDYYGVPQDKMDYLVQSANELWPCIKREDYLRNYCGILPKWVDEQGRIQDFKIEMRDEVPNAINLVGIESPGLTAALPIARRVVRLFLQKEQPELNDAFNPRRRGIVRFEDCTDEQKAVLVRENPDYGEVICRCEKVTRAELLQAIHNPLGVHTMVGIKYRTRSMMGRCQGGYCQMRLAKLIAEETGCAMADVVYARKGSNPFTGEVRP